MITSNQTVFVLIDKESELSSLYNELVELTKNITDRTELWRLFPMTYQMVEGLRKELLNT